MRVSNKKKFRFIQLYIHEFFKAYSKSNLKIKLYFIWSLRTYIPIIGVPFQCLSSYYLGLRFLITKNLRKKRNYKPNPKIKFVYINLMKREDRRSHMVNQLAMIGIEDYLRFDAIESSNGMLGCLRSHREVIRNWNTEESDLLVVMEDDIFFKINYNSLIELIHNFHKNTSLDVLTLGNKRFTTSTIDDDFVITDNSVGAHFYVLKKHMKTEFIKVWDFAEVMLLQGISPKLAGNDVVWKTLQRKYFFASTKDEIVGLIESHSDITTSNN